MIWFYAKNFFGFSIIFENLRRTIKLVIPGLQIDTLVIIPKFEFIKMRSRYEIRTEFTP